MISLRSVKQKKGDYQVLEDKGLMLSPCAMKLKWLKMERDSKSENNINIIHGNLIWS